VRQSRLELQLLKVGSCRHLECLAMRGGALRPMEFPALSALMIHSTHGPILFDTGYAEHFHTATGPLPERLYRWATRMRLPPHQTLERQLARFGLSLRDVRVCIVSHFHGDHIAGLRDLPESSVLTRKSGYSALRSQGRWRGVLKGGLCSLLPSDVEQRVRFVESNRCVRLPEPWSDMGDGYDLFDDGSVIGIPLPGHAPGHMGLLVRDAQDRQVLLAADACWSRKGLREMRLPSSWVRPVMHDWRCYRSTFESLHKVCLRHPEIVILPSHCEESLSSYQSEWNGQ
jgi:glyoxylase-like metal-dependent hydrolase (beta-lactamase superfamily II)